MDIDNSLREDGVYVEGYERNGVYVRGYWRSSTGKKMDGPPAPLFGSTGMDTEPDDTATAKGASNAIKLLSKKINGEHESLSQRVPVSVKATAIAGASGAVLGLLGGGVWYNVSTPPTISDEPVTVVSSISVPVEQAESSGYSSGGTSGHWVNLDNLGGDPNPEYRYNNTKPVYIPGTAAALRSVTSSRTESSSTYSDDSSDDSTNDATITDVMYENTVRLQDGSTATVYTDEQLSEGQTSEITYDHYDKNGYSFDAIKTQDGNKQIINKKGSPVSTFTSDKALSMAAVSSAASMITSALMFADRRRLGLD